MKLSPKSPAKIKFEPFVLEIVQLLEEARRFSARAVNSIMTATYWEIGRRIVENEQKGEKRAEYGKKVIRDLSKELSTRFGKGFSERNLEQMRQFYQLWKIPQTVSAESGVEQVNESSFKISQTVSADLSFIQLSRSFPLSWSHYVLLLSVKNESGRKFYESEAFRGGWSVRQLERQINSQFYERTALSRNKAAMLVKGSKPRPEDFTTPEEEIKSPFMLEFLGLKDEYSESDLEEALIKHLETFLLELGQDFAFVARQKRLRLDDEWYRVDLVFYHRRLRCLVLIDLKMGRFTHADAGQMHMYLNYAREHWMHSDENPPVGLILCAKKSENVVKYALGNLPNKIMAAEYMTELPKEDIIAAELAKTYRMIENRSHTS